MQNPNDSSPVPQGNLDSSDHNLSNELRQLAEEEVKSGVITNHPQRSFENMSRIQSNNNTVLAHSELIQLPLQQFLVQQQQGLRVSLPAQTGNVGNVYLQNAGNQQNGYLRSSLPAQANNPQRQGNQVGSAWIAQPATTQARVESGNRSFVFPNTNVNPGVPRPNNMMQQQVIVQNRPSSSSPNRIVFNYQGTSSNVSPPPVQPILRPQQPPQPQPQPQPQIQQIQQQQQQIQPQQIQQIQQIQPQPQPQPQIPPQNNNALFILPPTQPNSQVVLWQQRYFMLLEKFHFYYSRLQIIHKKSIYLDQAILQTKRPEQLELLRSESQDLLTVITTTEQELVETIHKNREILTVISNWRQKYQELSKAYETLKQSQQASNKDLLLKVQQQTKQIAELQTNYNSIVKQNEEQANRNRKLQQQLAYLNQQLRSNLSNSNNHKEFQLQLSELSKIISQKNDVIVGLRKALEAKTNNSPGANAEIERQMMLLIEENNSNQVLIGKLREENQNLSITIKKANIENQAKISKYQELIYQYEATIQAKQAQTKKLQSLLDSKTSDPNPNPKPAPSPQNSPRASELQIENRRLKHQLTLYEQSHSSDIKIYNSKIQELVDKLKMISNQRDSIVANLQEKVNLLDSDLNRKDGTVRNLRDRILELEEEKRIRDLDKKYEPKKPQGAINQSQEMNSLKRELNDRMNEIQELQAQLTEYKRISNEYEDSLRAKKHEINGLKRDLEEKSQGVQDSSQLNELLRKKNDETHQLEEKIVELEKFRNQNEILKQENAHLVESMRKKHAEVSDATDKVYLLQKRLREFEVLGDHSPKLIQLAQENELLQNAINKKDQEIIKLRQNGQLLQSNIIQLQLDIEKYKNRLNAGEKNIETQRSQLRARLSAQELKTVQYERKIAGLEEVRTIMTEQINTLTAQIHLKFQNTQRIELELKQERSRSKAFQTQLEIQSSQLSQMAAKVREWEKKYQNLSKDLQSELDKKKDLTNTKKNQVFNLNNKCIELQNTLRNRQSRIKQLQKSNELLNSKIRNFDHNIQEIEYLKHKISEYEHKISYQNHRFTSTRLPDLEPTQIFERKVIYQLKIQNQQLRKQLGLAPKPEGKEANIPEKDNNGGNQNVNQRLNDFNKKLEEIISQNAVIDYSLSGDELYKKFQRDRRLLIQRHNEEITQLKVKIHELQGNSPVFPKKYTNINQIFNEQLDFYKEKNQELELRVESHIKVNRQLKESLELLLKSQSGDHSLTYYKEQVDKSNDTIVSLQKQLKKVNEELKKLKEDALRINSKQVIQPSAESESKLIEQTRRINQLTLEITLLEKDRVSREESVSKSEAEVKRLKITIDQLRSSKDELQRQLKDKENTYQDELAKLANKLRFTQSEVQRLNEILSKRQDTDSNELKALRIRVTEFQEENKRMKAKIQQLIIGEEKYQREITKNENQVHILMSENQRLKDISQGVGKRHREGDAQLQGLRVMISDFQGKIKNLESLRDGFGYRESQLQQQIGRLSNQIKLLNAEIERLTEFTQKKVNDKDLEINRLKDALNKSADENSHISDQLRDLKLLSFKSNETGQEIFTLKQEINSLKVTLNMKHTQSENRLREIYELNDRIRFMEEQYSQSKRSFELNISEMQVFIRNLENETANYKKIKDSGFNDSNLRIQTLQEQLRALKLQREQEISSYTSKITLLEIQLRDSKRSGDGELQLLRQSEASLQQKNNQLTFTYNTLNSQYELLSQEYEYLKIQFTKREEIITKMQVHLSYLESQINLLQEKSGSTQDAYLITSSRYTIQYLRSVFVEIDTLLEEEPAKPEVLARVNEEIQAALAECARWNESLSA